MTPMVDPRRGDVDNDASSTKQRSLLSLAGTLLAEISLPKLVFAWLLLIGLPALLMGAAPLIASIWFAGVSAKAYSLLTGLWSALLLLGLIALGWFGGRPLLRLAENSFWSLNALAVQPGYVLTREVIRQLVEGFLPPNVSDRRRGRARAASAAVAGIVICVPALAVAAWAWPSSHWLGGVSDLVTPHRLAVAALFNSIVLISGYVAVASLLWGITDANLAQPLNRKSFDDAPTAGPTWRVAHLSDIHVVGERYGFRIESGRSGPQGNERLHRTLAELRRVHADHPLHLILITGDMTDAGLSSEWAEFLDALEPYPELSKLMLLLPGNHDVNVVDKANPARLELPGSPKKRLRQIRTLSALEALQGSKVRLVDTKHGRLGKSLSDALNPHRREITTFANRAPFRKSMALGNLWAACFPMVRPPERDDGLGIILLNSNVESHFSFTNALGLVSTEQAHAIYTVTAQYPRAYWIIALHHHLVEYPKRAKALSERIGTALINGSWFVRHLLPLAGRAIVMHGHRHIDWIGDCGGVPIVSAPSPVMNATDSQETYFHVLTLKVAADGHLDLLKPERVPVAGRAPEGPAAWSDPIG
jgi:predicted MPP superfamily phosphohydrolase